MEKQRKRIWLSLEQQLDVVKRYTTGESPDKIADSLGICANNVRNTLRKHNVTIRSRSEARTKLSHWKEAFDTITPESAYWIGFLFADGSVYDRPIGASALTIALQARDRGHLEKLRAFLKSEHSISERTATMRGKIHEQVLFVLRSAHLTDTLKKHGMGKKSLERIAPDYLAKSRDFWRGMIDGDGYITDANTDKPRIGLYGNKTLMQQFLNYLRDLNIAKTTEVRKHQHSKVDGPEPAVNDLHEVCFVAGPAAQTIYLLYRDACIALDRKLVLAQPWLDKPGWRNRQTPGT